MIFGRTGKTYWHHWFAWRPVEVTLAYDEVKDSYVTAWVWLQWIQRRWWEDPEAGSWGVDLSYWQYKVV